MLLVSLLQSNLSGMLETNSYEGTTFSEATIALQPFIMTEEYLALCQHTGNQTIYSSLVPIYKNWTPPNYGTLKINSDDAFIEGKIGISIFIRNHLDIPVLAKAITRCI